MNTRSTLIESLEFQANQAFAALRWAVTRKEALDNRWASELYKILGQWLCLELEYYKEDFDPGSMGAEGKMMSFGEYRRRPQRGKLYDRYILQYLTGFSCSTALNRMLYPKDILRRIEEVKTYGEDVSTMTNDLFAALQQKDLPYLKIYIPCSGLRECGYAKPLWDAVKFVRKNYPPLKVL